MSNRQRRKALADEFLNYEFGWVPFVSDLQQLYSTVKKVNPILDSLEDNSGKLVRRRYEFRPTIEITPQLWRNGVSPYYSPSSNALTDPLKWNQGQVYREELKAVRQWFSGAFTYYVPPRDGSLRTDMARAVLKGRKLFGLSLTPDVIWNLSPWSWLVDWFSNADSVLTNWTNWALYNQVLWYGYIMEHSVHAYRYTFTGQAAFKQPVSIPTLTMVSERKLRRQATPYGFGFSWNSLSAIQKTILAALGITKSH
jgi:hypothetical protein